MGFIKYEQNSRFKVKIFTFILLSAGGYGVSLIAQTKKDIFLSADSIFTKGQIKKTIKSPEEIGEQAVLRLLDEIYFVNLKNIILSREGALILRFNL